jgi:starch synthase
VSPTYAREIQGEALGFGLQGLLRHRAAEVSGILNGIDTEAWDPARDPAIESRYDATRLEAKRPNKAALQRELGLEERADVPLLGFIGRLVEQKGADLVAEIAPEIARAGAQLTLLGVGERRIEDAFGALAAAHPGRIAARIGFSEPLAHRIEAGADIFLMPSRFEPCGLNQLYSLRYGTPPVVRRTGGLADSVSEATGFLFDEATPKALLAAVRGALGAWRDAPRRAALQRAGMARDSGWAGAAREYLELYRSAIG